MNGPSSPRSLPDHEEVCWLEPRWPEIIEELRHLGSVWVTTRNRTAEIAKHGIVDEVEFDEGPVGLVTGGEIDLRLFTQSWHCAWATPPDALDAETAAICVADAFGRLVMSIELSEASDEASYQTLVESFETDPPEPLDPEAAPDRPHMSVEDVDEETRTSFQQAWRELDHTHEFHGILREHGLERRVGLELAPDGMAQVRDTSVLQPLIEGAEARSIPLMLFVSSGGCLQIHTGPVELETFDDSLARIEGPQLEMDVQLDRLDEAWRVVKPMDDSYVTSVECFDDLSELSFQIFGERKPGGTEREDWRTLVEEIMLES